MMRSQNGNVRRDYTTLEKARGGRSLARRRGPASPLPRAEEGIFHWWLPRDWGEGGLGNRPCWKCVLLHCAQPPGPQGGCEGGIGPGLGARRLGSISVGVDLARDLAVTCCGW